MTRAVGHAGENSLGGGRRGGYPGLDVRDVLDLPRERVRVLQCQHQRLSLNLYLGLVRRVRDGGVVAVGDEAL